MPLNAAIPTAIGTSRVVPLTCRPCFPWPMFLQSMCYVEQQFFDEGTRVRKWPLIVNWVVIFEEVFVHDFLMKCCIVVLVQHSYTGPYRATMESGRVCNLTSGDWRNRHKSWEYKRPWWITRHCDLFTSWSNAGHSGDSWRRQIASWFVRRK